MHCECLYARKVCQLCSFIWELITRSVSHFAFSITFQSIAASLLRFIKAIKHESYFRRKSSLKLAIKAFAGICVYDWMWVTWMKTFGREIKNQFFCHWLELCRDDLFVACGECSWNVQFQWKRSCEYVYGNIKVLNHQKALEYDLCLMFYVLWGIDGKVYLKSPTHVFS